ncbi:MAG: hypothetical protein AB7V42_14660 [Thermoleophilia bacterium]
MDEPEGRAREIAEAALGHPVPVALPPVAGGAICAASVAGEPPRGRIAWVDAQGTVVARVGCPPGRPSRWRPAVAAIVELEVPGWAADRVLVVRLAGEAAAARPLLAGDQTPVDHPAGGDGLVLARLPAGAVVLALDALDTSGEAIGRLTRPGIAELRFDGSSVSGRMGSTHGMGAGIGAGTWSPGLAEAAFEAGYAAWLPAWTPPGLTRGRPRVEPDIFYPAAPPALVLPWSDPTGAARVLLRQAPAPLASPELGGRDAREVEVGEAVGVLRGRRLVTLVWETPERAFGIQVRGIDDAEEVALRVARSVGPDVTPP